MTAQPTIAIVQARMTSTRLPGKVLAPFCGRPALAHTIDRLRRTPLLDAVVIATSVNGTDDPVAELAEALGVTAFRGSELDVLQRFAGAAEAAGAGTIVRVTGDCPMIDPEIVNQVIQAFFATGADYASSALQRSYPIGMDAEVFTRRALDAAAAEADRADEREHVTPFIYRRPERFRLHNVSAPPSHRRPDLRLTLDTPEDQELISAVFDALYLENPMFSLDDILAHLDAHPHLCDINRHVPHKWLTV